MFRDVYLPTTAPEDKEQTPKRAETGLTGWIACYPKPMTNVRRWVMA